MFCSNCGKTIEEGSAFCKECGAPVPQVGRMGGAAGLEATQVRSAASPEPPGARPVPPPPVLGYMPPPPPPPSGYTPGWQAPPPRRRAGLIVGIAVAVVIVLAGAGVGAYFGLRGGGSDQTASSSTTVFSGSTSTSVAEVSTTVTIPSTSSSTSESTTTSMSTTTSVSPTTSSGASTTGSTATTAPANSGLSARSIAYAKSLGGTPHKGESLYFLIGASVKTEAEAQAKLDGATPRFGDMQSYFIVQRSDNFDGMNPGWFVVVEAYRGEPSQENLQFGRRGFPDVYVKQATVKTEDPIPVYEDMVGQ